MKKILAIITTTLALALLIAVIMDKTRSKTWFQDAMLIERNIEDINESLNDLGKHYQELISEYPGMTTVELIEHGKDYVTIKTNEGTMKRTNITVVRSAGKTLVEFDEEYITNMVTSNAHFLEKFEAKNDKTKLTVEINDLTAPGFLGFFLRNFGSKNIGNGFLDSYGKLFNE